MAEATNELIYEVLKKIQRDVLLIRHDMRGLREEITAMRAWLDQHPKKPAH